MASKLYHLTADYKELEALSRLLEDALHTDEYNDLAVFQTQINKKLREADYDNQIRHVTATPAQPVDYGDVDVAVAELVHA